MSNPGDTDPTARKAFDPVTQHIIRLCRDEIVMDVKPTADALGYETHVNHEDNFDPDEGLDASWGLAAFVHVITQGVLLSGDDHIKRLLIPLDDPKSIEKAVAWITKRLRIGAGANALTAASIRLGDQESFRTWPWKNLLNLPGPTLKARLADDGRVHLLRRVGWKAWRRIPKASFDPRDHDGITEFIAVWAKKNGVPVRDHDALARRQALRDAADEITSALQDAFAVAHHPTRNGAWIISVRRKDNTPPPKLVSRYGPCGPTVRVLLRVNRKRVQVRVWHVGRRPVKQDGWEWYYRPNAKPSELVLEALG